MSKNKKTDPVKLPGGEDDFIWIGKDVYVKRPEALPPILEAFRQIGYEVVDCRKADYRILNGVSVERMEQEGWPLWFVHVPDHIPKCLSCKKRIAFDGVKTHKHKCENCGAYTYQKIVPGANVTLSFRSEKDGYLKPLTFKAHSWESDAGLLYLYPEPLESRERLALSGDKAKACMQRCRKDWEAVELDGQPLIRVRHHRELGNADDTIYVQNVWGSKYNFEMVKVWAGKEYPEWAQLPVPDSLHIYEEWHLLADPENREIAAEAVSEAGATRTADTATAAAEPRTPQTKRRNGLLGLLSRIWK